MTNPDKKPIKTFWVGTLVKHLLRLTEYQISLFSTSEILSLFSFIKKTYCNYFFGKNEMWAKSSTFFKNVYYMSLHLLK